MVTPCWSCEGHLDGHGQIGKLPTVWFYSQSHMLPRLISDHLAHMYSYNKNISHRWVVELVNFGQGNSPVYAIKVDLNGISDVSLVTLQEEIRIIARSLFKGIKASADGYSQRFAS